MSAEYPTNGKEWKEYRLLVLNELRTLNHELAEARSEISAVRRELDGLKLKIATFSGAVSVIASLITLYFFK